MLQYLFIIWKQPEKKRMQKKKPSHAKHIKEWEKEREKKEFIDFKKCNTFLEWKQCRHTSDVPRNPYYSHFLKLPHLADAVRKTSRYHVFFSFSLYYIFLKSISFYPRVIALFIYLADSPLITIHFICL